MKPLSSLIAAIDKNRGIGKNNKIPWHVPEDFAWFKQKTSGQPIIMGRKTFESLGKPLPNRLNIIVTRDQNFKIEGAEITHSVEQAIHLAKEEKNEEVFIIGGAQIYEQALPFADRIYLTKIDGEFACDTFFPEYSEFKKETVLKEGESGGIKYKILQLEK